MAMTWLQIVQAISDEMGLSPRPTVVAGATDDLARQLGALCNRCGDMLLRMKDWTTLTTEATVTTQAPTVLTGTLTTNSPIVTGLSSTSGLVAGRYAVTGTYITQGARILSIDSPTQVTLTETATGSGSQSITFGLDTYPVPADFNSFVNRTQWDRSRRWELVGPMSPQEDEWMRSGIVATGPRRRFRQFGRGSYTFRIWPPPTSTDSPATLSFEYMSSYWAQDASGTPLARFTSDTDSCVYPDDIMVMGVKWLWLQAKGFDYAAQKMDWDRQVDTAQAQDGGSRTLNMAQMPWPVLIGAGNVPDVGYGGTGNT